MKLISYTTLSFDKFEPDGEIAINPECVITVEPLYKMEETAVIVHIMYAGYLRIERNYQDFLNDMRELNKQP